MGWSYRTMGIEKLAESKCPESGEEMKARKIEIAMSDCFKIDLKQWENNDTKDRYIKTADRFYILEYWWTNSNFVQHLTITLLHDSVDAGTTEYALRDRSETEDNILIHIDE